MKFDNHLQKDIFEYFNQRPDFHFHGFTGTFFFNTWKKGMEKHVIESKKPLANKTAISASVRIYSNKYAEDEKHGVEMAIDFYLWSAQSQETVFQGWVESIDQLKTICASVGL
jgi:hypothetical protein